MRSYRKDDVTRYGRNGHAAVNIKIPYVRMDTVVRKLHDEGEIPATLTLEWIDDNVPEERYDAIFWHVCQAEYEYFTEWATEIIPGITFEQDGRSGGWAVSNLDPDDFDAVMLAKWRKVERIGREIAAGVPAQVILSVSINEYAPDNLYVDAAPVEEAIPA
jgi:hypothetical protein